MDCPLDVSRATRKEVPSRSWPAGLAGKTRQGPPMHPWSRQAVKRCRGVNASALRER